MSFRTTLTLSLGLLISCAAPGLLRVEDASLSAVSGEYRQEIARRTAALEDSTASAASAEKGLGEAEMNLAMAKLELDQANRRLKGIETLHQRAVKLDLETADLEAQQVSLRLIKNELKTRVALAQAQRNYAIEKLELHEAEVKLAETQLEASKAQAVSHSDGPRASSIKLSDFKKQVAKARQEVASRHKDDARAWKIVEKRRDLHKASVVQLPDSQEGTRALMKASREREKLVTRVGLLEQRIRELERENVRLQGGAVGSSTTAASYQ